MVVMSCDDKNKFIFVCDVIASRIHTVLLCDVMTSAEKWFRPVTSDDLEKFEFHGGTPRKRDTSDGNFSSTVYTLLRTRRYKAVP